MASLTKRTFWNYAFFYGIVFLLFTSIDILSFRSPLFSKQNVLFYRGISLLAATTMVSSIICFLLNKHFFKLSLETLIAALIISVSLNLSFFIVFPVTFDRSVTTYLLSILRDKPATENCQGLTDKALEQYFISEYVLDKQAVQRRIKEQSIINMVERKNNCIQLTTRGQNFLKFLEIIKKIFGF